MSSATTLIICLVIFNILTMHYAYRIYPNDEPIEGLFRSYEPNVNDEERSANLFNSKQAEEYSVNNNYYILCHPKSTNILCRRFDNLSRRDTGFLRFGRKR